MHAPRHAHLAHPHSLHAALQEAAFSTQLLTEARVGIQSFMAARLDAGAWCDLDLSLQVRIVRCHCLLVGASMAPQVVQKASAHERPVAAHAHGAKGVVAAVKARWRLHVVGQCQLA